MCVREGLGQSPAAIHHTDGKTKPEAHFKVLPLCAAHHQHGGYGVALHAGKAQFESRYGTEEELLQWVAERLVARGLVGLL